LADAAPDVVVIGGGAIGCATAWELARRGAKVALLERNTTAGGATWAAAGMIAPFMETEADPAFQRLATASYERYPRFVEALRAAADVDVEFEVRGKLHVAFDEQELHALGELGRRGIEFDVQPLDAAGVHRLEPHVTMAALGGLLVRRDATVNNRRLGSALWSAATAAGVRIYPGACACEVRTTLAGAARVASEVTLERGSTVATGAVVIAAGAWSAEIGGLPEPLPIRPVRGQMLALDARGAPGSRRARSSVIERVIMTADCYIIPRLDGTILVGATVEEAGFAPGPTPRGVRQLADAGMRAVPALADLPIAESWFGFRPAAPDALPILGEDPDVRGVIHASGHYRNGILLTPITAEIVADVVMGRSPVVQIDRFTIGRFRSQRR
jgi:glycine oxidase